jgi:hypothetical protein
MSPQDRYRERNGILFGGLVTLPIERHGAVTSIAIRPIRYVDTEFFRATQWWLNWAFWLGSALSLCVAAILAWRRPESPEVRTLALTLILINIGEISFR